MTGDPYPWKVVVVFADHQWVHWSSKTREGARREARELKAKGVPQKAKVVVKFDRWGF